MTREAESAPQPPAVFQCGGLSVQTTTKGEGVVFDRFFAGYDKAFVLPNEKEDREGFSRCFALNEAIEYVRLSALYGPYCETALIAEEDGHDLGGANFIAMCSDPRMVTANLNYIYVNEAARGRGAFSRLLGAVLQALSGIFPGAQERVLIFIEQNDPFRMSAEDYARDTRFTGLDQFDRLRIWARRGARVVDFPYAQPPLSGDQQADDTLVYSVLGAGEGEGLDACTLYAHLRGFFGVSVLKGAPLEASPAAYNQIESLAAACAGNEAVPLLDPSALLAGLSHRDDIARFWRRPPRDLRAALRNP